MKQKRIVLVAGCCLLAAVAGAQVPQSINYQGRLLSGTNLVNGDVQLWLRLYTNAVGGVHIYEDTGSVSVVDGLYSTQVGDGTAYGSFPAVLTNNPLYVEVIVNSAILAPRERISAVAYALLADGVRTGGVSGSMLASGAVRGNHIAGGAVSNEQLAANAVTGDKIAAGAISSTDIAVGAIAGDRIIAGTFVHIAGDTMTGAMTNQQSLTAARYFNSHNSAPGANAIALGGTGNTIAASSALTVIAGGTFNDIGTNSPQAAIGGGYNNDVSNNSWNATIAGGSFNQIGADAAWSAIGGGFDNGVGNGSQSCTVGGGVNNHVGTNAYSSTISGGLDHRVGNSSSYATVLGGRENGIGTNADYACAAGRRAKANHSGTFVWADSTDADFRSSASDQFLVRAGRGMGINTTNPIVDFRVYGESILGSNIQASILTSSNILNLMVGMTTNSQVNGITFWEQGSFGMSLGYDGTGLSDLNKLVIYDNDGAGLFIFQNSGRLGVGVSNPTNLIHVVGGAQCNGSTWLSSSDRNLKENFRPVDPARVLAKVEALPISEWNYIRDGADKRHIGPVAQDFYEIFGVGDNDTTISAIDPSGVALVAIQALAQKNAELKTQIESMQARLEALEKRGQEEP